MSVYSVKMRTRRSFQAGAGVGRWPLPSGGRPGQRFSRIQSTSFSDARVGLVPRRLGDPRHLVEELALPAAWCRPVSRARGPRWRPPSARPPRCSTSSSSSSARSSSAPAALRSRLNRLSASAAVSLLRLAPPRPSRWPAVDGQRPGERLDRAEQPLLQRDGDQRRRGLARLRLVAQALGPQLRVLVEQARERQLGRVLRQAVDVDLHDLAVREALRDLPQVLLQPPDHHLVEQLRPLHRDAAAEAVRVEQLQQRREAVRVAVVRRRRQEQPMLEARREVAHRPRQHRVDRVLGAAGRRGVVGLVEDQQRAGARSRPASRGAGRRRPRRAAARATG